MKKGIFYIIIFAAILPFAACKEDVPTIFAEPDGIYFSAPADSMTYTFAKYPTPGFRYAQDPCNCIG